MIKIFPAAGKRDEIIEVFNSLREPVRAVSGCLDCSITVETSENGAVCYAEKWQDRDALDLHLKSKFYKRILEVMELSMTQPVMEFYEINTMGGLELVERVRLSGDLHNKHP